MKFLRFIIIAIACCLLPISAQATTCFYKFVGGTTNYSDTTNWFAATNGGGGACAATGNYPHGSADTATFDANSGAVTVVLDVDLTITNLNAAAFTGTFDDSANHNVTANLVSFTTGNPAVTMGSGTWAQSGSTPSFQFTTTGTFSGASAVISLENSTGVTSSSSFFGGSHSFGAVSFASVSSGGGYYAMTASTFASCTVSPKAVIAVTGGSSMTCTAAVTFVGTTSSPILITTSATNGAVGTFAVGAASTCAYCGFRGITSSNMAATCSQDYGGNTLNSISNSCGGTGGGIIGG